MDKLLRQCRFSKRYQGYSMLKECVEVVLEDEDYLLHMTKVYRTVAANRRISWNCVERNIRTIFDNSWKNGGKEELEKLTGGKYFYKPPVGELIEVLVYLIKENPDKYQKK